MMRKSSGAFLCAGIILALSWIAAASALAVNEAIELALDLAEPGDCVLLAGKGHETEQVFADRVIEHDDRRIADEWLRRRHGSDQDNDGARQ